MSATPITVVEDLPEEQVVSLRQLVRERLELSDDPDPHRAINGMVHDLPHDVLVRAAQFGLVEIAKHLVRDYRRRGPQTTPDSGKWDAVREAVAEHRDLFAHRVWNGAEWKFMADCTKADLQAAAEVKRVQADGLLADVERYTRLSKAVKRDQVVSDLEYAKVERIFNA
jgi:hypothetical protein